MIVSKFVPDWFVTNKLLEKIDDLVLSNNDIDLEVINSDIATVLSDTRRLFIIDLTHINLDDNNFDEDDLGTIVYVRLVAWSTRYE